MSFELHHRNHLEKQLRAIVRRQLRRAAVALRPGDEATFGTAVHESRKRVKKVRAVTAFLRETGAKIPHKDRARLKSAAEGLSRLRDSAAIVDALDRLRRTYPKQLPEHTYAILRRGLVVARDRQEEQALRGDVVRDVAARLKKATKAAQAWTMPSIDWSQAISVLTASYRRSRKAMHHARSTGQSAAVHRWRKELKTLWYQLRLAKPLTKGADALVDDMRHLEKDLGDDHNLVILAATLRACRELRTMRAQIHQIDRFAARMRQPLRRRAFALGRRLHRRKPREFARWLRTSSTHKLSGNAAAA
jgi:CHAD domain-containing protein